MWEDYVKKEERGGARGGGQIGMDYFVRDVGV